MSLGLDRCTDYEISATGTISLVGDPKMASDPGYLGHFANDAVTCASPYLRDEYEAQSLARSNPDPNSNSNSLILLTQPQPLPQPQPQPQSEPGAEPRAQ